MSDNTKVGLKKFKIPSIEIENTQATQTKPPEHRGSEATSSQMETVAKTEKRASHVGRHFLGLTFPQIFPLRSRSSSAAKESAKQLKGHILVNYVFKRATFCDVCHMLLHDIHREGFRCKICKAGIHLKCFPNLAECPGVPLGSFSYNGQNLNVSATEKSLDNVYEVLKQGVVLRSRRESASDLSTPFSQQLSFDSDSSKNEISERGEPIDTRRRKSLKHQLSEPTPGNPPNVQFHHSVVKRATSSDETINRSNAEMYSAGGSLNFQANIRKKSRTPSPLLKVNEELHNTTGVDVKLTRNQIKIKELKKFLTDGNLFVTLHKYDAQEKADLSVKPGDLIIITDKKDVNWWLGEHEGDKGYVPSNRVMQVKPDEDIYTCLCLTTLQDVNNQEISLKKNQIVTVRTNHPVSDPNYLYARCQGGEGLARKEDLKAL